MPFDIGAGLAQLGEAGSKFAGLAALEQQKSGLEAERLKLANDLTTTRESAGRQEQHGLDIDTLTKRQAFEGTENDKNRTTTLEAHRISANASAAAANAHIKVAQMQIDAAEKLGDFHYNDDGTASMVNKRSGVATPVLSPDGTPRKFDNPEKARAVSALATVARDELNNTARLYETDLKQAQAELTAAMKSPTAMIDPSKDPAVAEARKGVDAVRQRYEPKITTMTNRMNALYGELGVKAGVQTSGAPGVLKYDAQGNRIDTSGTPAAAAPTASPGMIDSYGGPR